LLVEHNLIQVIEFTLMKAAPRFTHQDRLRALRDGLTRYAARGVTAIYEGHGVAPEVLRVYREAHERGQLTLRCLLAVSPTWDTLAEAERAIPELGAWAGGRGAGDDRLRIGGICLHYGGDQDVARILHTAQPYTGWAGFVESANDPVDYARQAELAARSGLRRSTLVTRCLPEVLDAWEQTASRRPIRDLRWVLVHLHVATESQIDRIRQLGAVATTNPISHLWRSGSAERARLGSQRDWLIPHRTLARLGVPFGMATDNKPANPWLAFQAAVDRRDMTTGEGLGVGERRARPQALRALTGGGAWVTLPARERGVLAAGRAADLAVLDRDPLSVPSQELSETGVRLTMVGGQVVHGAP